MKNDVLDHHQIDEFQQLIWDYYAHHRRDFPWRYVDDPYHIVVSEIMLQQTQTYRVEPKFNEFIQRFPTWHDLSSACWPDVLIAWQGLGYNTRAKRLHDISKKIVQEFQGSVPSNLEILKTFAGIGPNTAGSICAFAFNMPTVFAETNIRAVFIYHFFPAHEKVSDKQILPLIDCTLDKSDARSWYYALMDYGVWLKKNNNNPARRSKHFTHQSKFEGSDRQIRSMILKQLLTRRMIHKDQLIQLIDREPERVLRLLDDLCNEKLIIYNEPHFMMI